MSEQEANKGRMLRLSDEMNAGNLDYLDEYYVPELAYHGTGERAESNFEELKEFIAGILEGFPDARMEIQDIMADGDRVAARWVQSGTHQSEAFGMPATGRQVTVQGITIARFEQGRVVEEWEQVDILGLLQQLGAIPSPQATAVLSGAHWTQSR